MRIHFIDTSGSIPRADIAAIRSNIRIGDTVVCFDTALRNEQVMKTEDDLGGYMLEGGGGTLLQPIIDRLNEIGNYSEPTLAMVYSDMYFADAPNFHSINGDTKVVFVPIGEHSRELEKLAKPYQCSSRLLAAEPTIFLAEIVQCETPYMNEPRENRFTRLVRAPSEPEAEYLVQMEFGLSDPYGISRDVSVSMSAILE